MQKTERFAVIGDPVHHSLSPIMQSAAFAAAGIDAIYESERVSVAGLGEWVRRARTLPYAGFNVTIPHKERIAPFLDDVDASARRVGAANTVVRRAGALIGYNTDLPGFAATVLSLDRDFHGRPAVVLGAGGSARAVVLALTDLGADITVCNRDEPRANALVTALAATATTAALDSPEAIRAIEGSDLLVNTTPLGMEHLPISPLSRATHISARTAVIDLVYGRTTVLVTQARAAGCIAIDGIEMLVQQGAAAFQLWTGFAPDLAIMRAACRRTLMEVQPCSAS